MPRFLALLAPMAALLVATAAYAGDTSTPIPLGSDGCNHTFVRAGYPDEISRCAQATDTCAYDGYYVGGGHLLRGGGPGPLDGVWGWDYFGPCWLPHRIVLRWCDGGHGQGGIGSYKTDGPRVPNPLGIKLPSREADCAGH
jgi:hypothetical protein